MGNTLSANEDCRRALRELIDVERSIGDVSLSALRKLEPGWVQGAVRGSDETWSKSVQYLAPSSLRKGLHEPIGSFQAAVEAGVLEFSESGSKRQSLAHFARTVLADTAGVNSSAAAVAVERRCALLVEAVRWGLKPEVRAEKLTPDEAYRPAVLEVGTRVRKGPDWTAKSSGDGDRGQRGVVQGVVPLNGVQNAGVVVAWDGGQGVEVHRWGLPEEHRAEGDPAPRRGNQYFDLVVVRHEPAVASSLWEQDVESWDATHGAGAATLLAKSEISVELLKGLFCGAVDLPAFVSSASVGLLAAILGCLGKGESDAEQAAAEDLVWLVHRRALAVILHSTLACSGGAPPPAAPAGSSPALPKALITIGCPEAAAAQLCLGLQWLLLVLRRGSAVPHALLASAVYAVASLCALDRSSGEGSLPTQEPAGATSAPEPSATAAGPASAAASPSPRRSRRRRGSRGGAAAAPAPAPAPAPSPSPPQSQCSASLGVIANMVATVFMAPLVQLQEAAAQALCDLPEAARRRLQDVQVEADNAWAAWLTGKRSGSAPTRPRLLQGVTSEEEEAALASAARAVDWATSLGVVLGRACSTVSLGLTETQQEETVAGWLKAGAFSGGLGESALSATRAHLAHPIPGPKVDWARMQSWTPSEHGMDDCPVAPLVLASLGATTAAPFSNTAFDQVKKTALPSAGFMGCLHAADAAGETLLKLGLLDSSASTDSIPALGIVAAHWLDAHCSSLPPGAMRSRAAAAKRAGVPLDNPFGTVHVESECLALAALTQHSGLAAELQAGVKAWLAEFVQHSKTAGPGDAWGLKHASKATPQPSEQLKTLHRRFSAAREYLRSLRKADTAGDLQRAMTVLPASVTSTLPRQGRGGRTAPGGAVESKEEELAHASESKEGGPRAEAAPVVGSFSFNEAQSDAAGRPLRTVDVPTSLRQALQQFNDRAALLLLLAPGARSVAGASPASSRASAHDLAAVLDTLPAWGTAPTVSALHLPGASSDAVGEDAPGLDCLLQGAVTYLTHGHNAPPRALLPVLLVRQVRAAQRTAGLLALRNAVRAALAPVGQSGALLSSTAAQEDRLALLLPTLRGMLQPFRFAASGTVQKDAAGRGSKGVAAGLTYVQRGSTVRAHYLKGTEGAPPRTAAALRAAWTALSMDLADALAAAAGLGDALTAACAAHAWSVDVQGCDFPVVLATDILPRLAAVASAYRVRSPLALGGVGADEEVALSAELGLDAGEASDAQARLRQVADEPGTPQPEHGASAPQGYTLLDPSTVTGALLAQAMPPADVGRNIRQFAETPVGRELQLHKLNKTAVTALGLLPGPGPFIPDEGMSEEDRQRAMLRHAEEAERHAVAHAQAAMALPEALSWGVPTDHPMVQWWIRHRAYDGVGGIVRAAGSDEALSAAFASFHDLASTMLAEREVQERLAAQADAPAAQDAGAADAPPSASEAKEVEPEPRPKPSPALKWLLSRAAGALLQFLSARVFGARRDGGAASDALTNLVVASHAVAHDVPPPAAASAAPALVRAASRTGVPLPGADGLLSTFRRSVLSSISSGAVTAQGFPAESAAALLFHSDAACRAVGMALGAGEGVADMPSTAFRAAAAYLQRQALDLTVRELCVASSRLRWAADASQREAAPGDSPDPSAVWKAADAAARHALTFLLSLRDLPMVRAWQASEGGLRLAWTLLRHGSPAVQMCAFHWCMAVLPRLAPADADAALWWALTTPVALLSGSDDVEAFLATAPPEAAPLAGSTPGTLTALFLTALAGAVLPNPGRGSAAGTGKAFAVPAPARTSSLSSKLVRVLVGDFTLPTASLGEASPLSAATLLLLSDFSASSAPTTTFGGVFVPAGFGSGHSVACIASQSVQLLRVLGQSLTQVQPCYGQTEGGVSMPPPPQPLSMRRSTSTGGASLHDAPPPGSWAAAVQRCLRDCLHADSTGPVLEAAQGAAFTPSSDACCVGSHALHSALGWMLGALHVLGGHAEVLRTGGRAATMNMLAQAATAGARDDASVNAKYSAQVIKAGEGEGSARLLFMPSSGRWHPGLPSQQVLAPLLLPMPLDPLPAQAALHVVLSGPGTEGGGLPSLSSCSWFDQGVLLTLQSLLTISASLALEAAQETPEDSVLPAEPGSADGGAAAGDFASEARKGLSVTSTVQRKKQSNPIVPAAATTLAFEEAVMAGAAPEAQAGLAAAEGGQSAGQQVSALGIVGVDAPSAKPAANTASFMLGAAAVAATRALEDMLARDMQGAPLACAIMATSLQATPRHAGIAQVLVALSAAPLPLARMVAPRHLTGLATSITKCVAEASGLLARVGALAVSSAQEEGPKEDSPEVVARKAKARDIESMGFDYELALKGLELKADDMERVMDWLLSGEAEAFRAGDGLKAGPAEGEENPRYAAAQTLAMTAAKPTKLCIRALELMNDDANAALNWLFDVGVAYLPGLSVGDAPEMSGPGGLRAGLASIMRTLQGSTDDAAVLDDVGVGEGEEDLIPEELGDAELVSEPDSDSDSDSDSIVCFPAPGFQSASRPTHAFPPATRFEMGGELFGTRPVPASIVQSLQEHWLDITPQRLSIMVMMLLVCMRSTDGWHPLLELCARIASYIHSVGPDRPLPALSFIDEDEVEELVELAGEVEDQPSLEEGEPYIEHMLEIFTRWARSEQAAALPPCVPGISADNIISIVYYVASHCDDDVQGVTAGMEGFLEHLSQVAGGEHDLHTGSDGTRSTSSGHSSGGHSSDGGDLHRIIQAEVRAREVQLGREPRIRGGPRMGGVDMDIPGMDSTSARAMFRAQPRRQAHGIESGERPGGLDFPFGIAMAAGSGPPPVPPQQQIRRPSTGQAKAEPKADKHSISGGSSGTLQVVAPELAGPPQAFLAPLPTGRDVHAICAKQGIDVASAPWAGSVVSILERQGAVRVVGEDTGQGTGMGPDGHVASQWRVTLTTGVLLADSLDAPQQSVAVLDAASGLWTVVKVPRSRLRVHAISFGIAGNALPTPAAGAALLNLALNVQAAQTRYTARRVLANLLLALPALQRRAAELEGGAAPVTMATLLHRKALMRIVKLVAATEDTFGVHTRGEQAIAGGAGVGATPGAYLSAPRGGVQAVLPGAPCTGAWLLLLRRWLDADTLSTAAGAAASGTADLTLALTTEAARHIDLATNPSSAAGGQAADDGTGSSAGQVSFLMRESLHPHYHRCTAHDTLSFPGARALWVFFDPRSQTHPDARLQFFAGSRGGVPLHSVSGEGSAFRPFVVNGDTLSFAFHAGGSADSAGWGYRMYVAPMLGLAWRNEGGVATGDASLEWACYALEFLLGDLQRCVEAGEQPHPATKAALHSSQVFNALVTYLRARGTPFKSRVVSLLTQLLKAPEAFPEHDPPDLALLHGMERAVFRHIEEQLSRRSGKSFPSSLLQLVELLITARVAARTLRRGGRTGAPGAPALERHVTLGSAELQAPGGLAEVFLPHAVRQGLAEAAEAGTASAVGSGAGAASSSVTLTPEQRAYLHEVQATDTCSSPPPDESAEATRSRPLSDVLMESMDIIETIHAQQQAAAAREGAALPPLEQAALHLLPLPPALLARCMLDAGWVQGPEEITAATLVSAAVSLGTWSADADQELVQWLTTITSPARRAVVAELTNRLKEAGEDPAAYDWDTACVGSAKSPLSINTAILRLHPHGTDEPGPSGLPVHPEAPDDALAFPGIAPPNMPLPALRLRVALLQLLNRRLARVLPLIDVVRAAGESANKRGKGGSGAANAASAGSSSGANQSFSLGHKLRMLAHCVFIDVKQQMLEVSIAASWTGSSGSGFSVQLDNREAFSHREAAAADPSLRAPDKAKSIAAQLYRGLLKSATGKVSGAKKDSKAVGEVLARGLRSQNDHRESLWKVEYRGEDGMDWGGLYRDCFSRVVDDLFSADLDVFLPCPNAEQGVGVNMDKWLPNPNHTTPSSLAFFVFVGRLIGVNLRHNMQLPFDLAPAVWDRILARPLPTHRRGKGSTAQLWELHDKREADRVTALEALSPEEFRAQFGAELAAGAAEGGSDAAPALFFVAPLSDGSEVELCEGGAERRVSSPADLAEYCALLRRVRSREFDAACSAMRRGLTSIIPPRALQLLTWREMELLVCGDPIIDVALLQEFTEYSGGYEAGSPAVQRFWRGFEALSNAERSKFIRFAWGRSRLPPREKFTRRFKLQRRGGGDDTLPVAHACFFSVEMPEYSSDELMLQRLRVAINFGMSGEFLIA